MKLKDFIELVTKNIAEECLEYELKTFDIETNEIKPVTGIHFVNDTIEICSDED